MWSVYNHAKTWSTRPSQLLGLDQPYLAYCVDEAVATWGNHVVNELDKIDGKTDKEVNRKRHNKLLQLLEAPDEQRFRKIVKPPGTTSITKTR